MLMKKKIRDLPTNAVYRGQDGLYYLCVSEKSEALCEERRPGVWIAIEEFRPVDPNEEVEVIVESA